MTTETADRRWPAEWEPHEATWIAWPHHEPDWPGKLEAIPWVYAEIVRVLALHERVEILCHNHDVLQRARACLEVNCANRQNLRLHEIPTDRVWTRDSGATGIRLAGRMAWVHWAFNAWAKYDNYRHDERVPHVFESVTRWPREEPRWPDGKRIVLEGGSIETDGQGTMLTTQECLLSDIQQRNPGRSRIDYEAAFSKALGIQKTIWLGRGCEGDDTHGHVDDIARFVAPGKVILAFEPDASDENHEPSVDNLKRLESSMDAQGRRLQVVKLPMPRPVVFDGQRLPASYANFYIANSVVLMPTFNDPNDRLALNTLAELFPDRQVVGIHSVDLVWGLGTLHCLTQQQPAP
jgi:agmatine deiminase